MIGARIVAVESRKQYAEQVYNRLDLDDKKIIYDDRGFNGGGSAWYNARRCWLDSGDDTHRLVIQDDVYTCIDFMKYVNKCIEFKPNVVWSFMCGSKLDKMLKLQPSPYVRVNGCKTSGQAIIMPRNIAERMIEETDTVFGKDYPHDDVRIGWYCAVNSIPLFTVNPSLIEHLQIASTIPHHTNKKRNSKNWIGEDVSKVDWENYDYTNSPTSFPYLWIGKDNPRETIITDYSKLGMSRERKRIETEKGAKR